MILLQNMKQLLFIAIIGIGTIQMLSSQNLGDNHQKVYDLIKKKYVRDSVADTKNEIRCFAVADKREYRVYKFTEAGICDTIEQYAPLNAIDFYKSSLGMTMAQCGKNIWCIDNEKVRTLSILTTTTDKLKIVTSQKIMGFIAAPAPVEMPKPKPDTVKAISTIPVAEKDTVKTNITNQAPKAKVATIKAPVKGQKKK